MLFKIRASKPNRKLLNGVVGPSYFFCLFSCSSNSNLFHNFTLHLFNVSELLKQPVLFKVISYQAVSFPDCDRFNFNSSSVSDQLCS